MSDVAANQDSNSALNAIRDRVAHAMPAGWTLTSLGECFSWSSGGTPKRTEPAYFGGSIPWVVIGDLNDGVITETENSITDAGLRNSSAKWVEPGSILIAMYGSIGKLGIAGIRLTTNQAIAFTNPHPVDSRYLYYFLQWQRPSIARLGKGATQLNISQTVLKEFPFILAPPAGQRRIVAELEKQFSRLDDAVANLRRVKANLSRYAKSTIDGLTHEAADRPAMVGTVADIAISLDNLRRPVNKAERATRPGTIPYLGANGQTGWIDVPLFDEELVLVVEDETFVGRTAPFCYYFSGKCWVNNHTHVLRARHGLVTPKYLNLALSYYPFIPLTTGSTGRRKLTKAALMSAPIAIPSLADQQKVVAEVERRLSIVRGLEAEVDANLTHALALRQAVLRRAFGDRDQEQPEPTTNEV